MAGGIHPPEAVIKSWPKPNYVNPPTRPPVIPILSAFLNVVLLAVSGMRLWVRFRIQKSAGLDDYLYIAAASVIFVLTILGSIVTDVYELNRHVWDVQIHLFVIQRKYILVTMVLFSFANGTLKVSILLFYRRLSSGTFSNVARWILWIFIGSIVATTIVFCSKPLFACRPIAAFWDQLDYTKLASGYKYTCFNEGADLTAASTISAIQDIITAMLPNIFVWKLRVRLTQKISLVALFSVGYCAAGFGILRLVFTQRIYYETYDATWYAWMLFLLAALELHLAALCASAPALKAFFNHYGAGHLTLQDIPMQPKNISDNSSKVQRKRHREGDESLLESSGLSIVGKTTTTSVLCKEDTGFNTSEPHQDLERQAIGKSSDNFSSNSNSNNLTSPQKAHHLLWRPIV